MGLKRKIRNRQEQVVVGENYNIKAHSHYHYLLQNKSEYFSNEYMLIDDNNNFSIGGINKRGYKINDGETWIGLLR